MGLNYHDGLFLQKFREKKQYEDKNPWITKDTWLTRTEVSFPVAFGDFTLQSVMYDIDVPGYENGCNKLHLFDLDSVDEGIIRGRHSVRQDEYSEKPDSVPLSG